MYFVLFLYYNYVYNKDDNKYEVFEVLLFYGCYFYWLFDLN